MLLLTATKKKFTVSNYFLISMDREATDRSNIRCLGKLRA